MYIMYSLVRYGSSNTIHNMVCGDVFGSLWLTKQYIIWCYDVWRSVFSSLWLTKQYIIWRVARWRFFLVRYGSTKQYIIGCVARRV